MQGIRGERGEDGLPGIPGLSGNVGRPGIATPGPAGQDGLPVSFSKYKEI